MFQLSAHLCRLAAYFEGQDLVIHKPPQQNAVEVSAADARGIKLVYRVKVDSDARRTRAQKFKALLPAQYLIHAQPARPPRVVLQDERDSTVALCMKYDAGRARSSNVHVQFRLPLQDYEHLVPTVLRKDLEAPAGPVDTQALSRVFAAASNSVMRGAHSHYQYVHLAVEKDGLAVGVLSGNGAFVWTHNCQLPLATPTHWAVNAQDAKALAVLLLACDRDCLVQALDDTLYITYKESEYTLQLQVPCERIAEPSRVLLAPFLDALNMQPGALVATTDATALATLFRIAARTRSVGTLHVQPECVKVMAAERVMAHTACTEGWYARCHEVPLAFLASVSCAFNLTDALDLYVQDGIVVFAGARTRKGVKQRIYVTFSEINRA